MQLEEDRVAGGHLHAIREALSMQLEEDRVAGRHLHAIREALSMQLGREAPRWDAPRGRRACRMQFGRHSACN